MEEFDVIVIGSGSGLDVASAAVQRGLDVAVVEDGPLGGTCLNRGCIPSKMLIHRADLVEDIKNSEKFGVDSEVNGIDFSSIVEEVNSHVEKDSDNIYEGLRQSDHHNLFNTVGEFVEDRTLEVNEKRIKGEKVIVAAGSRPFIPPINGIEDVDYITSKEGLKLKERPNHLVIVGGGYVGVELGHFFDAMGSDVSIIGRSGLLPREDSDVNKRFTKMFDRRVNVIDGYEAIEAYQQGDEITVVSEDENGDQVDVSGDELLIAAGRTPNSDRLKVEEGGIDTDERGFVKTDEYLRTTAENVWALGDIIGNNMYKHTANLEAQVVYWNAFTDHSHEMDYSVMPRAIFSKPQVAGVGKTEEELEDEGIDFLKAIYEYEDTAMGLALKEEDGFVKVLVNPDNGEILGTHIIGPDASILIHEVVVAMNQDPGNVFDITDAVHIHPALNEVVKRAFSKF